MDIPEERREASTPQRTERPRTVGNDLGDLKDLLGDAYEKVDGLSDISWGSDAGEDADTVAPDPVATRMLQAESEDERAVQDVMNEVEQLRVLLGESKQQSGEILRPVPDIGPSCGGDERFTGLNEVDRLLAEDAQQGAEVSFNPSVNQRNPPNDLDDPISSGALVDDDASLVPPSKRIRREILHDQISGGDIAVARNPTIENLKWEDPVGGGKYGSIIGSQSQRSFQGLDLNDMQSDANLSVRSRGRRRAHSRRGDGCDRSKVSADFEGLLSESQGPSRGKSLEECNRSVCTADFEGLMSDRGGGPSKRGKSATDDGNRSIRTADFEGLMSEANGSVRFVRKDNENLSIHTADFDGLMSEKTWGNGTKTEITGDDLGYDYPCEPDKKEASESDSDDKIGLDDVLNGTLPKKVARKNIILVLENVLEKNSDLQLELEATMASIDEAIEHNAKAIQVARAMLSMRNDNGKIARPRSSCVLDEGRPVVVNHTVQTSYWSSFNGKHPEMNNDTKRMQTLMKFMPIRHRFNTNWTLHEEELLCSGLTSYVKELCTEASLDVLEKRQQNGTAVSMGTARNVISELGSLDYKSPVALEIISKFTKPQWKHVAKMYVGTRSGFECLLQWNCFTRPDRIRSKFTRKELMKIKMMANELNGRNWVKVAKELQTGRSPAECFRAHIQSLALPALTWNKDQDAQLAGLIEQHGTDNWETIGLVMGRTGRACQCRFRDVLMISNGRVILKSRALWDLEDDLRLLKAVKKHGKRWREVAFCMGDRRLQSVRERYVNNIDPTIDNSPFTPEEKQQILELGREEYKNFGRIRWSEVQRKLSKKRHLRGIRFLYIYMIRAVEQEEDPFAVDALMKPTGIEHRLKLNVDGSKAVWSEDGAPSEPIEINQQSSDGLPLDGLPPTDEPIREEKSTFSLGDLELSCPEETGKGATASDGTCPRIPVKKEVGSKKRSRSE